MARRLPLVLLLLGVLAMLCATPLIPWAWLCSLPRPFSTYVRQIQFPWRLLGVATPLLCLAAACGYLDGRWRRSGAALAVGLCLVFSGAMMGEFAEQEIYLGREDYLDTRIGQYEYTYVGTEKDALFPGDVYMPGISREVTSCETYEKQGTNLHLTVADSNGAPYIEVALLYYPGYRATVNGEPATVARGDNNRIRVYGGISESSIDLVIWYEEPLLWRAAEAASLLGAALLIALLVRRAKRRAA